MFCPEATGSGASPSVTDRSADALIIVVALAVLLFEFGSEVADESVALSLVVPLASGSTFTTTVKVARLSEANVARVNVTVPAAPTAAVVALHPAGVTTETKVVLVGVASSTETVCASLGPTLL